MVVLYDFEKSEGSFELSVQAGEELETLGSPEDG
jgi:hypothetical protein